MNSSNCSEASILIGSLFATVEKHCQNDFANSLPSEVFISFHTLLGHVFAAALDIIDRSGVTIYKGEKSGRQVAVVVGSSGSRYTLLLHGQHCHCESYQFTVLEGKGGMYCKHLLALKLAVAMNRVSIEIVNDERVHTLIEEMLQ